MVYHNCGVLEHVSRFASRRQILVGSFRDRPGPCGNNSQERMSVRWCLHSANYPRKPRGTPAQLPERIRSAEPSLLSLVG